MITLVVGGARSGKSSYGEAKFKEKNDVVYIATSRKEDHEMEERVKHHKSLRPLMWRTFEGTYNLTNAVGSEENYLLDCITVMISNIMYDMSKELETIDESFQRSIEDKVINEIYKLVDKIKESNKELVMVTNEVGCSIVPDNHIARVYRDIAGRVNQRAAEMADEVYAVICGIPLRLK
ncbi:MAG: bifunctional adenosylcobinamide kinase/adenosylcobinamide-phosphate guanylyltransferase [Solirubrobacterales bacterium]